MKITVNIKWKDGEESTWMPNKSFECEVATLFRVFLEEDQKYRKNFIRNNFPNRKYEDLESIKVDIKRN